MTERFNPKKVPLQARNLQGRFAVLDYAASLFSEEALEPNRASSTVEAA